MTLKFGRQDPPTASENIAINSSHTKATPAETHQFRADVAS